MVLGHDGHVQVPTFVPTIEFRKGQHNGFKRLALRASVLNFIHKSFHVVGQKSLNSWT